MCWNMSVKEDSENLGEKRDKVQWQEEFGIKRKIEQ